VKKTDAPGSEVKTDASAVPQPTSETTDGQNQQQPPSTESYAPQGDFVQPVDGSEVPQQTS
jgi:hypothetical protein